MKLRTEQVPVSQLQTHPRNVRQGNVDLIAESLKTHGQYRPIVVQKSTNYILAGNHTWKAAQSLNWADIAVTYVDVDDEEALRILLVDNRANDVASYDESGLGNILRELLDTEKQLEGTGFYKTDLDDLLEKLGETPKPDLLGDPDEIPNYAPAKTVPGDVWLLGDHRLMCGDSTSPTDVATLMNGELADMVWTDPPYNVAVDGAAGTILNDDMDSGAFRTFVQGFYASFQQAMRPGAVIYLSHGESERATFTDCMTDAGFKLAEVLIWVKGHATLSRQDFNWQHEPILYGWKEGAGHYFCGDFTRTTVIDDETDLAKMTKDQLVELARELAGHTTIIRHDRPTKSELHPTMKPVALVERMINWSSKPGWLVLDLFGGSGSTLIAAHAQSRRANLMELDPKFCDVICTRFQTLTGIKPIAASTGNEHDFITGK